MKITQAISISLIASLSASCIAKAIPANGAGSDSIVTTSDRARAPEYVEASEKGRVPFDDIVSTSSTLENSEALIQERDADIVDIVIPTSATLEDTAAASAPDLASPTSSDPADVEAARAIAKTRSPVSHVRGKVFDRFINVWFENTNFDTAMADRMFSLSLPPPKNIAHVLIFDSKLQEICRERSSLD